jgi:hypothetical protein
MTTVLELLSDVMQVCGVLDLEENLSAAQAALGLRTMQRLLSAWSTERLLIFQSTPIAVSLAPGTATYTIGIGGVVNTTRPVRINHATVRFGGVDYEVIQLPKEADYDTIGLKTVGSPRTEFFFYDPSYPLGELRLYPTPTQALTLTVVADIPLTSPATLNTVLSFPEGYEEAFHWSLVLRLNEAFGQASTPIALGLAQAAKAAIMNNNVVEIRANLDPRLAGLGRGRGRGADPTWIFRGGQ